MGDSIAAKIIREHLVEGSMVAGEEIGIRIDQTLTQDATGTMVYLHFEAMGLDRVRSELSVSYVDHNTLQTGFENADDHLFLQSAAARFGAYFSRPGNGICHQVHLERFARPGKTILGSDSHTPTAGGIGALGIGAGGLDVAAAMSGAPFYLRMPEVVRVELTGELQPWVSAKDVILELLRRLTVKGGLECIFEYGGPGVATLSVPQRATIANMGAELGLTSSVFPSDERTLAFLRAQEREDHWVELLADPDASYQTTIELDLGSLEPLAACPHSPDNVRPVRELAGTPVSQVNIGSCTNSSYEDLVTLAMALGGRTVHQNCSVTVSPGSRQVLTTIAKEGHLTDILAAGVRLLECACGPCIGMGQAPPTGGVSIRTFNRNFPGRSGTPSGQVYLTSVEVAAASALTGCITDPRDLGQPVVAEQPNELIVDDGMVIAPPADGSSVEVIRGPNIQPLPTPQPIPNAFSVRVLLKAGDNVTTDHIVPAGARVLPLRSNIPALSQHVFSALDPDFAARAEQLGGGVVVAGQNYGQGSSREHAALAPRYLGVTAVLARSFARIHRANLINFGVLPLTISDSDYADIEQGDELEFTDVHGTLRGRRQFEVRNLTKGTSYRAEAGLTGRQTEMILVGGLLAYAKQRALTS